MFFYKLSICLMAFSISVVSNTFGASSCSDALSDLVNSHSRTLRSPSSTASASMAPSPAVDNDTESETTFPDPEDPFRFPKAKAPSSKPSTYVPPSGNILLSTSGYTRSSRVTTSVLVKTSTHVTTASPSTERKDTPSGSLPKHEGHSVFQTTGGSIAFKSRTPSRGTTIVDGKQQKK